MFNVVIDKNKQIMYRSIVSLAFTLMIVLIVGTSTSAQDLDDGFFAEVMDVMNSQRQLVLEANKDGIRLLVQNDSQANGLHDNELCVLLRNVSQSLAQNDQSYEMARAALSKTYSKDVIKKLTDGQLQAYRQASEVVNMQAIHMISDEPPYPVIEDNRLMNWIRFVNLSDHDRVLHLGQVNSNEVLLLAMMYDSLSYAHAHHQSWHGKSLKSSLSAYQESLDDSFEYRVMNGQKNAYRDQKFNTIIISELLGMEGGRKKLLKSLKSSMTLNTDLIIKQSIGDPNDPQLRHRISDNRLRQNFRKTDFELVEEIYIDCYYYAKLRLPEL